VCLPAVAVLLLGVLAVVAGVVAGQGGLLQVTEPQSQPSHPNRTKSNLEN
jgi:hypothetical protein